MALRALAYFEIVSTIALLFGLLIGNLLQPGSELHLDLRTLDASAIAPYFATAATPHSPLDFFLEIIPTTVLSALADGKPLQVLLISLLFGSALLHLGPRARGVTELVRVIGDAVFVAVGIIMRAAPLAVFGAMSFATAKFGTGALASLGRFIGLYYVSCILFCALVLGFVARSSGFSLRRLVAYLWDELVLVFATASSEAGLPRMIEKLESAGCSPRVVGFAAPTGYSFNMDGGAIYMTLATLFLADVAHVHLSLAQQLALLGVFLLASKGIAGVPGGSFVTLTGALAMIPDIPIATVALILSVDRCLDAMRAAVNMLGNAVAVTALAKWEDERDDARLRTALGA